MFLAKMNSFSSHQLCFDSNPILGENTSMVGKPTYNVHCATTTGVIAQNLNTSSPKMQSNLYF